MWRFWTRGWGPRYWWYWFINEGFPFWVARHLPHRVSLWAFIRVFGACGCSLDEITYKMAYDFWEQTKGQRGRRFTR